MIKITTVCCGMLLCLTTFGQTKIPEITVEDLNGKSIPASNFLNTEGPTLISFWATWCKPCVLELNEMQDLYQDWKDETNVKIIAISVDDARSAHKVNAFVNGRRWDFDVYLDKNSDLKRALNISNVPFSLILDKEGNIVSKHAGYVPGDEDMIYEEILETVQ